jgi:hypothetical protein
MRRPDDHLAASAIDPVVRTTDDCLTAGSCCVELSPPARQSRAGRPDLRHHRHRRQRHPLRSAAGARPRFLAGHAACDQPVPGAHGSGTGVEPRASFPDRCPPCLRDRWAAAGISRKAHPLGSDERRRALRSFRLRPDRRQAAVQAGNQIHRPRRAHDWRRPGDHRRSRPLRRCRRPPGVPGLLIGGPRLLDACAGAVTAEAALDHSSADRPAQSQPLGVVTAKVDPAVEA